MLPVDISVFLPAAPDAAFLTAPQPLDIVVVTQEHQTGKHRHREGKLRLEPPDVEGRDQGADNSPQRRITGEQHRQKPGAYHQTGQIITNGRNGPQRGSDPFAAAKVEEHRVNMAKTGGDGHQTQPEWRQAEAVAYPHRDHPLQDIENHHARSRQFAAEP